jgi:hypothetical protein
MVLATPSVTNVNGAFGPDHFAGTVCVTMKLRAP